MRRRKKRGQFIAGQTLFYVLGIVIIGLLLLFGYNAVQDFLGKAHELEMLQFRDRLLLDTERLASSYGSVEIMELDAPSGIKRLCFVDLDEMTNTAEFKNADAGGQLAYDNWLDSDVRNNIFLIKRQMADAWFAGDEESGASYIRVGGQSGGQPDENWMCFDTVRNRLRFRMEGRGNAVLISDASTTTTT